jgi:putative methyltransferase (TIGR04325 family)
MTQSFNVWEGVYNCWDEAPGDNDAFDDKVWLGKVTQRAQDAIADIRSSATISPATRIRDYILPVAASMLLSSIEDDLRILDFGGGMAASYFPLISSLPDSESVEFHVVEGKEICIKSRGILGDFKNLHFHQQLPKINSSVHIVHAGSSIQYVKDWKKLLSTFVEYEPKLMVLEDLMAGDVKTFVTLQNYYGKKMRSWFLNINEIIETVDQLGYKLIYRAQFTHDILGKTGPLPMKNFEPSYRLNYGSHLMFEKRHA